MPDRAGCDRNCRKHLDAESIFPRAREKDANISLTIVYRTLAVLTEMGLIERSYLARTHEREHFEPGGTQARKRQ